MSSFVSKITPDNTAPITGCQLKELTDLASVSSKECERIRLALLARLTSKKSPDVKAKVLKAIKHVAQTGPSEFRINMQRDTAEIKACITFRCEPDSLRGDKPQNNVREAAKECFDAIFNAPAVPVRGAIQMEGFGGHGISSISRLNEPPSYASMTNTPVDSISSDTYKPTTTTYQSHTSASSSASSASSVSLFQSSLPRTFGPPKHTSSSTIGNNNNNNNNTHVRPMDTVSSHPSMVSTHAHANTNTNTSLTAKLGGLSLEPATGLLEKQIITKATTASGIRVRLNAEEKNKFIQDTRNVDQTTLIQVLLSEMDTCYKANQLPRVIKMLDLLEAMLGTMLDKIYPHVMTYVPTLQTYLSHTNKHVENLSRSILVALGVTPMEPAKPNTTTAAVAAPASTSNTNAENTQQQQQPSTTTSSSGLDVLSSLFDNSSSYTSTTNNNNNNNSSGNSNIFDLLNSNTQSTTTAAAPITTTSSTSEVFDFMQNEPTTTTNNNNTTTTTSNTSDPLADLLNASSINNTQQNIPNNTLDLNNLYGQTNTMNMNIHNVHTDTTATSAFNFMETNEPTDVFANLTNPAYTEVTEDVKKTEQTKAFDFLDSFM